MENNNCHFQVGSLVTANLSWQLALPISIGANFGHNPYSSISPPTSPVLPTKYFKKKLAMENAD